MQHSIRTNGKLRVQHLQKFLRVVAGNLKNGRLTCKWKLWSNMISLGPVVTISHREAEVTLDHNFSYKDEVSRAVSISSFMVMGWFVLHVRRTLPGIPGISPCYPEEHVFWGVQVWEGVVDSLKLGFHVTLSWLSTIIRGPFSMIPLFRDSSTLM